MECSPPSCHRYRNSIHLPCLGTKAATESACSCHRDWSARSGLSRQSEQSCTPCSPRCPGAMPLAFSLGGLVEEAAVLLSHAVSANDNASRVDAERLRGFGFRHVDDGQGAGGVERETASNGEEAVDGEGASDHAGSIDGKKVRSG